MTTEEFLLVLGAIPLIVAACAAAIVAIVKTVREAIKELRADVKEAGVAAQKAVTIGAENAVVLEDQSKVMANQDVVLGTLTKDVSLVREQGDGNTSALQEMAAAGQKAVADIAMAVVTTAPVTVINGNHAEPVPVIVENPDSEPVPITEKVTKKE